MKVIYYIILLCINNQALAKLSHYFVNDLAQLQTSQSCNSCDLSGIHTTKCSYESGSFIGADLSISTLYLCNFENANFTNTFMVRANITGSDFTNANFTSANLTYVFAQDASLQGVIFKNTNLQSANLTNANLSYANFTNANLTNANLYNSHSAVTF